MGKATVEFKIDVMSDGTIQVVDKNENLLEEITEEAALLANLNKPIKKAMVTPMFTYVKTNSGIIFINGRAYRIP